MGRGALALFAALQLMLMAACRQEPAGGSTSLSIQTPENGAAVSSPVRLAVSVDGAQIGPPETGRMHLHVYVGDSGDYEVVTSLEGSVPAPEGDQTLRVVLASPNHDETGTADSVSINVTGGQPPSGGEDDGGGSGGGYGY